VRDVGSVILASTIVVWALFRFEPYELQKKIDKNTTIVSSTDHSNTTLSHTYAGMIGRTIEPLVKPMGLDWQVGVGILASFLAREVFVSTMAVVYGLETSNEEDLGLKTAFKSHISPLSGFCLLLFFTLSMQCVSTMATTRRETGSILWPLVQFLMMSGSGYLLAVVAYWAGSACGWA
jgi:ferrous iron transport protein B